jgi:L-lactate dehydrogenase complex protein LldG
MSEAREQILARVRDALRTANGGNVPPGQGAARGPGPVRPELGADHVAAFTSRLAAMAATWQALDGPHRVPAALQDYLTREGLPPAVVVTSDAVMASLDWPQGIAVSRRAAEDGDRVSVTTALAGVAETGTLALVSGPQTPTTLNFLPEHHIVVLWSDVIVPYLEDLWPMLRALPEGVPRTVNLITGPSRTADVEQTIQLGAHGPRKLHLLLIGAS